MTFLNSLMQICGRLLKLEPSSVVLRDEKTGYDSRHLSATYTPEGNLRIEGQDLGDGVEAVFGCREYEWIWTIAKSELPKLAKALGTKSNLLDALKKNYYGEASSLLKPFLDEHSISYKVWSRTGD